MQNKRSNGKDSKKYTSFLIFIFGGDIMVINIDPELEYNLKTIKDLFYKNSGGNNSSLQDIKEFEESFSFVKYWILEALEAKQQKEN